MQATSKQTPLKEIEEWNTQWMPAVFLASIDLPVRVPHTIPVRANLILRLSELVMNSGITYQCCGENTLIPVLP